MTPYIKAYPSGGIVIGKVTLAGLCAAAVLASSAVALAAPSAGHKDSVGRVTEFAASTGKAGRTVKTGFQPTALVVAPDSRHVYVANRGSQTISELSAGLTGAIRTIHVAGAPLDMVMTPNGKLLYVSLLSNNLSQGDQGGSVLVIRTSDFKPVKDIPLFEPYLMAVSRNSATVYVASGSTGGNGETVTPIRTASNRAGKALSIANRNFEVIALAIAPSGRAVYVISDDVASRTGHPSYAGVLTVINAASGRVRKQLRIGTSPSDLAITPNGRTVYVSLARGVLPVSTSSNTAGRLIRIADYPGDLVITPNGRTLYVAADGELTPVSTRDNAAGRPIGHFAPDPNAGTMAVSPDGTTLYALTWWPTLSVATIRTATNTAQMAFKSGPDATELVLAPNGKTGYVVNWGL
jgi:DNA-binding beta-propeller fold protein YncE